MRLDPHSFNDSSQPEVSFFDLRARVDFAGRVLDAEATLRLRAPGEGPLDLDTRGLAIRSVTDGQGRKLDHTLDPEQPIRGARLRVLLPAGTDAVRVAWRTSPSSTALQWLSPAQTAGGREPFLFSQCQAVHARSVLPIQDTPRLRIRYRAEVTVPSRLRSLFAASFVSREERGDVAVETWEMDEPIPPYLFAFAIGDLASRDLGPRSRVWAEPSVVERAAWEFAGVDEMITTAERLFGPYPWGRFDILTMPPSFPYGGMENPRLTFLTPTLLAGDRTLVNVVAHELAHSWTGNLVTNASAEHFWLNEGFTVFAERRILEELDGAEAASLHAALGSRELARTFEELHDRPQLQRLRMHLEDIHPDDAFSIVPYEKGYLFLRALEEQVGRERFSSFLRDYIDRFRFRSLTSEEFIAFADEQLPGATAAVGAGCWLDEPGVPDGAPRPRSARLEAITHLAPAQPDEKQARALTPVEWQLYLESLPRPAPTETLASLDARFHFTDGSNPEVLVTWLALAAESGWAPAIARIDGLLGEVGRMKFLKPLYLALAKRAETRDLAGALFRRYRERYHPIAQTVIETVLQRHGVSTRDVNPVSLRRT